MFISGIDQSKVDDSTERWLDEIEDKLEYKAWYCGHWHVDKHVDKMHFIFTDWEILEDIR
jgi:3-oxoacid CoA-transferase subunit A